MKTTIPQTIQVPIYYYIGDDGLPVFDTEEMQMYFDQEINKLEQRLTDEA